VSRVALRSLAARRLRTVLTAIAVMLGVAMVTGALVETAQITKAFEDITRESVADIDVVVSPAESFDAAVTGELPTIPARVARRVGQVEGVAKAEGGVTAIGQLVVDGEPVSTFGAPPLVIAAGDDDFDPTETVEGRRPERPGEAMLLADNADDHGISVGDEIGVATRAGERPVEVVGTFEFGEGGSSLGGATVIELSRSDIWRWFDLQGRFTSIGVIADDSIDAAALSERIDSILPAGLKVQTAEENADEAAAEVNDQIGSFLTPALLALAGAAVLVGAFIIFNTFSITVAQRAREFAMLRALGATRRQVLGAVTLEALAIGLTASLAGLFLGLGVAKLLNLLFDAVGFGIPLAGLTLDATTVLIAFLVGTGTTVVAAIVPATRAMRTAPVAAIAAAGASEPSRGRRRATKAISVVVLAAGAALTAVGLFGSGAASAKLGAIGVGVIAIFVGVALSARYLVRPLASVIGYPVEKLFRTPGRLARENAERNPGRTALTSATLMVGLGLVVFVAVFAAGLKSSISGQIDDLVRADLIVYSEGFGSFSGAARADIEKADDVEAVLPVLFDQVEVDGEKSNVTTDVVLGVDPRTLLETYAFEWLDGNDSLLAQLGPGETLIEEQFAKSHDLQVGDSYDVETPTGGTGTLTAIGEYRDPTVLQGSISTRATLASISPARDPNTMLVSVADGADVGAVEARVEQNLEGYPSLKVENRSEYQQSLSDQLNQIVYMLYALLAMSVVISIFGIANSLFLSIHERTAELGVLRAIGATTDQLRRVIRYESVITSVIGGLLGTVIGIAFAGLAVASLNELGLGFSLPVGQLAIFLLVAVLVGVLGSIMPARRAARVDVLKALAQE
jgi:putative ABC transport system permease protein